MINKNITLLLLVITSILIGMEIVRVIYNMGDLTSNILITISLCCSLILWITQLKKNITS